MTAEAIGEALAAVNAGLNLTSTVLLLAGFVGKAVPPKASGVPYVKER